MTGFGGPLDVASPSPFFFFPQRTHRPTEKATKRLDFWETRSNFALRDVQNALSGKFYFGTFEVIAKVRAYHFSPSPQAAPVALVGHVCSRQIILGVLWCTTRSEIVPGSGVTLSAIPFQSRQCSTLVPLLSLHEALGNFATCETPWLLLLFISFYIGIFRPKGRGAFGSRLTCWPVFPHFF